MQEFVGWLCRLASLRGIEYISQIGVERQIGERNVLAWLLIKLGDGGFHFVDRDVCLSAAAKGIDVAQISGDAIHIPQLCHRSPSPVAFTPRRTRSQPYGERFRKIFIGMLLGIPAG